MLERLGPYANLRILIGEVLAVWPGHADFVAKSFGSRSESDMQTSDRLARMILALEGDALRRSTENYQWTCNRLADEFLYFYREGTYRCKTNAAAYEYVYNNPEFMEKYVNGLLLTQVMWKNQFDAFSLLSREFVGLLKDQYRHLEIGPGHGLLLREIATREGCVHAEGWDISTTSLEQTRKCLRLLGCTQEVILKQVNAEEIGGTDEHGFDSVVISEVLEHVERPSLVLDNLRHQMNDGGKLFVNIPINSPAPDHIYLFRAPQEVSELVRRAGFKIMHEHHLPMTGYTLERALKRDATVSCVIIAEK